MHVWVGVHGGRVGMVNQEAVALADDGAEEGQGLGQVVGWSRAGEHASLSKRNGERGRRSGSRRGGRRQEEIRVRGRGERRTIVAICGSGEELLEVLPVLVVC